MRMHIFVAVSLFQLEITGANDLIEKYIVTALEN